MPQVPLMSGIYTNSNADFVQSYPTNLEPVPLDSGISKGSLRSAAGVRTLSAGPGIDRGSILWKNVQYRVMGTKLVSVSGSIVTTLGDVGGSGPVSLTYGFDRLAIRSNTSLYYWDGTTLTLVTDPDLGPCLDVDWIAGYYISTDGTSLVATQLSDPTAIDPLKYGSAEDDPDPIRGVMKVSSELYAFGSNTIQPFNNVGGSGFPFQSNPGGIIPIGIVGTQAKTLYAESFAFCGSGRNNAAAVWVASGGSAQKLSTRIIDDLIAAEPNQEGIALERRTSRDEERLIVHLSDRSLCYLRKASEKAGVAVWYELRSGVGMDETYRLRNAVLVGSDWIVGDTATANLGVLDESSAEQFGDAVGWQFDTTLIYNESKGGIVHSLELVGLPGRGQPGQASAWFSYTRDGQQYSLERKISLGAPFRRSKRVQWRPNTKFSNYIGLRFRGTSHALSGWAALEATIEPLAA